MGGMASARKGKQQQQGTKEAGEPPLAAMDRMQGWL